MMVDGATAPPRRTIQTVAGPIAVAALGRTLMHEHLQVGFPGWESDRLRPGPTFREVVARCVDRIEELKSAGFSSLLDPCPSDMGRDVELMGEVAARTGFNIIFATGLYFDPGGLSHWKMKFHLDPKGHEHLTALMVKELTEGVLGSGAKAGVIKLATAAKITNYDLTVMQAAAEASNITGAPITTHTNAVLGDEQVRLLTGWGVAANRIVIGHSCGCNDHAYHMKIVNSGAYIGFDRFGLEDINTDENRADSLVRLLNAGAERNIIVSHDSIWCMRGMETTWDQVGPAFGPMRFTRVIAPQLKAMGVTDAQIETMLLDNPRRYFEGSAAQSIFRSN
jgi:phosphotriesterase-related protein